MTQWVTDKTPISNQTWRQHTDPRGLWIFVITASVALHLLLFWLMRSSGLSRSQQHSSGAVPIEFMEISPKARAKTRPQSKAKSVSPHPPSTTRKSGSASLPKRVTPENFTEKTTSVDRNTIAFANNFASNKKTSISPSQLNLPKKILQTPTVRQKIALTKPKTIKKSKLTPKLVTIPSPDIPDNIQPTHIPQPQTPLETPINRRPAPTPFNPNTNTPDQQAQALDEQNQSLPPWHNTTNPTHPNPGELSPPANQPQESPSPPVNGEAIGEAPRNQVGETPRTEISHPIKEAPPTPTGGGLVATWDIEANGVQKDRPDNLAKPIGSSREKSLNLLSFNREQGNSQPTFQASLLIDNKGNLIDILINPAIPEPRRTQYREYTQEVFRGQKFIPATSSNGDKPPVSNLVVRITIQSKSR